jgi:hypothetical protein
MHEESTKHTRQAGTRVHKAYRYQPDTREPVYQREARQKRRDAPHKHEGSIDAATFEKTAPEISMKETEPSTTA